MTGSHDKPTPGRAHPVRDSVENTPPESVESLYRFLIDSLTEYAVFAISPAGDIISWNTGAKRIFGYTAAEIIGKPFSSIFTPEDIHAGAAVDELANALKQQHVSEDRWHRRKDGSRFWGTNTIEAFYDRGGRLLGYTKLVRDTTAEHLAQEALGDSEERVRLLIESVPTYAICSTDLAGNITSWNSGAESTFGYGQRDIVGKTIADLIDLDTPHPTPAVALRVAAQASAELERWIARKDGTRFLCSLRITSLKRKKGQPARGYVLLAHDITERHLAAVELERRAMYDQLTQLPNRTSFFEHVTRAIALRRRHGQTQFAVLFIDLDHFKAVNDAVGHLAADIVLEITARRIERCVRSEDIVARFGGDEFAVLLNGITGVADATDAAARIQVELAKPLAIDAQIIGVGASIGIAMGNGHYEQPPQILRDADAAMYIAKQGGRARSIVFDAHTPDSPHDGEFVADLRRAVKLNELRVEYQPIIRLTDCVLFGFEALVRWDSPKRGRLLPAAFIPLAEKSELIIAIDRWAFDAACRQLARWQLQRPGLSALAMSVNMSSKEFSRRDFLAYLKETLAATAVEPTSINLEITESSILERSTRTSALIDDIRALGVELHADDFGTGYSSLTSLVHLPVSALKIDRSFVRAMDVGTGSELVRTIVNLAHNLGMKSVAEGIETTEQLGRLAQLGCEYGQGLLFSAPLDPQAAGVFLDAADRAHAQLSRTHV